MFDDWSKREVIKIVAGFLFASALVILGTVIIVSRLTTNPDDPLTKAGGLSPTQKSLPKMSN